MARDYQKELEDFVYIISHDFGAPLRHIKSFNELLFNKIENKLDQEERDYFEHIHGATEKAQKMLAALKEYSKLSYGEEGFEYHRIDSIIVNALDQLNEDIALSKATIKYEPVSGTIFSNNNQLERVFIYLIENAIQFSRGNQAPFIEITAEEQNNAWQFCISDNGVGIPVEKIDTIFQIFRSETPTNGINHLGVGLPMAKKIIENHYSEISIESEVNKGTKILFNLPKKAK